MNENYRIIIELKIINPVSIFKNKTNHMDRGNDGNIGDRGGIHKG